MTDLYLGLTGLLAGVFGSRPRYFPQAGADREIQSIFREAPIEVTAADGQILRIDAPTWRVARNLAPELRRGDMITVPDGRSYRVTVVHSTGSPSADAFLVAELHLITGG